MARLEIKDRDGLASIWIDGWNVSDMPHGQVHNEVLIAIKRAYEVGMRRVRENVNNYVWNIDACVDEPWDDLRTKKEERKP